MSSLLALAVAFLPAQVEPAQDQLEFAFENVLDEDGNTISIIGDFPGLDGAAYKQSAASIEELLQDFATVHERLPASPRLEVIDQDFNGTVDVVHLVQRVGGLKVLDMEVTAAFWPSGRMQSLNGRVLPHNHVAETMPRLGYMDVVAVASRAIVVDAPTSDWFPSEPGVWRTETGLVVQFGYSLQFETAAWRVDTENDFILIEDETEHILDMGTLNRGATGPCNIRVQDQPRSGGFATSLQESSNTRTEEITCEAADLFGTCYWELRREPSGFDHSIGRVLDSDGAEQQVIQACSSSAVLQFANTNGDALREQGAFYTTAQMRFFTNQNVWSQVSPASQSNVRTTVDDSSQSCAAFFPFYTDINCNSAGGCCDVDVLSHEYGHYVNWTYGGFSQICTAGSDEGNSVEETLATDFGLLYLMDDDETKPQYGAIGGAMVGNAPSAHTNNASILTHSVNCSTTALQRSSGQPFSQAIWELSWNSDCTSDSCQATDTSNKSTIWTSLNREAVLTELGTAMGFALSTLGQNVTYGQVRAQIRAKIQADSGSATATRAQRVFSHHGLTCPSCCTGC